MLAAAGRASRTVRSAQENPRQVVQETACWAVRSWAGGGVMQQGLHETVVTGGLERRLSRELKLESTYATIDDADQTHVLLRHVDGVLARRMEAIRDPAKRLSFVNE